MASTPGPSCDNPAAALDEKSEEQCKYCLQPADTEEGGELMLPCACRTPVHQRCLLQWLLQSRQGNVVRCEICHTNWQGMLPVPVNQLAEQLAAQRQTSGDSAAADVDAIAAVAAVQQLAGELLLRREQERRRAAEERAAAAEDRILAQEVLQNRANHLASRVNTLDASNHKLRQQAKQLAAQLQRCRWLCTLRGVALGLAASYAASKAGKAWRRQGQRVVQEGHMQHRKR